MEKRDYEYNASAKATSTSKPAVMYIGTGVSVTIASLPGDTSRPARRA